MEEHGLSAPPPPVGQVPCESIAWFNNIWASIESGDPLVEYLGGDSIRVKLHIHVSAARPSPGSFSTRIPGPLFGC